MATCTATADDHRVDDGTTEEGLVGNLQLSDLILGSWGVSWQPAASAHQSWLDLEEPHPPDEEHRASLDERNGLLSFGHHDAYGEDVLRLRRLIAGN